MATSTEEGAKPNSLARMPSEVLTEICEAVYLHLLPPPSSLSSLDPLPTNPSLLAKACGTPTALPSSYPTPNWPQPLVFSTLLALTRSSGSLRMAALPALFHSLHITYPRSWLALLTIICGPEFDAEDPNAEVDPDTDQAILDSHVALAAEAAFTSQARRSRSRSRDDTLRMEALQRSILASLADSPFHSIPPELLSPPETRDPSPGEIMRGSMRGRVDRAGKLRSPSRSPGRWKIVRRMSDALQDVMKPSGVYVPSLRDTRPPTHIHHLTFAHFRTIHMRSSYFAAATEHGRYITPFRLLRLLQEIPSLQTFGATEYMDSALELNVLEELLLRGFGERSSKVGEEDSRGRERGRPQRKRLEEGEEERKARQAKEDMERWADCEPLGALDLCGCVSPVFATALELFVNRHPGAPILSNTPSAGRASLALSDGPAVRGQHLELPLKRLGISGVASLRPTVLESFILLFPNLTMLDMSGTMCRPSFLVQLSTSASLRLTALSLARCPKLTSDSVLQFLLSPVCAQLEDLSLYGDATFPCPLTENDLSTLLSSPIFSGGGLRYVDLSSAPLTAEHLQMIARQPALRSLGLSHIPDLALGDIATFLLDRAPNVEILAIPSTSPQLSQTLRAREISMSLHSVLIGPLCTPPLSIVSPQKPAPTHLRVVELSPKTLDSLAHGAPPWRIIRSRGRRGWYVDVSCGWVNGVFRRDLSEESDWRRQLEEWSDARGNVGTGVGWHGRKMEILRGEGMLGRSDGLYGAASYAYSGE